MKYEVYMLLTPLSLCMCAVLMYLPALVHPQNMKKAVQTQTVQPVQTAQP